MIPDFLANAGGVTCSYFEQVQSNMNYFWEKDEVLGKLDVKMTAAFHAVSELATQAQAVHARRGLRDRDQPRGAGLPRPRLGVAASEGSHTARGLLFGLVPANGPSLSIRSATLRAVDSDIPLKVAFRVRTKDLLPLTDDAGAKVVSALAVELSAGRRTVDLVLRLRRGAEEYLRHVEFQSRHRRDLALRCFEYTARLASASDDRCSRRSCTCGHRRRASSSTARRWAEAW